MYRPDTLPAPLSAVLTEVRAWGTADRHSSEPAEVRAAWLSGLRQLVDAAEAVYLQTLSSFDAHADGQVLHGARSTTSWLQGALHLAPGEASTHVRVARASHGTLAPAVHDLRDGRVTSGHVAAIERSIRRLPSDVVDEAAATLGHLARQVDVGRLRTAGRAIQHAVDPDGALRDTDRQFERRYLHLAPMLDGMVALDGVLDPEGAAAIDAALAPFLVPAGEHDVRTTAQRRADGLVDVARSAIDVDRATMGGQPLQMQVLVPWSLMSDQSCSSSMTDLPRLGQSPQESTPLTDAAATRLGCDAAVARIVLGPDAVPLELGRSQRLFSPAQRRALAIRDGGCRFPGCFRPPRFTDAHHIVAWSRGGGSDLGNALLLCRYHHRLVHEGGWEISAPTDHVVADGNGRLSFRGPARQRLTSDPRAP